MPLKHVLGLLLVTGIFGRTSPDLTEGNGAGAGPPPPPPPPPPHPPVDRWTATFEAGQEVIGTWGSFPRERDEAPEGAEQRDVGAPEHPRRRPRRGLAALVTIVVAAGAVAGWEIRRLSEDVERLRAAAFSSQEALTKASRRTKGLRRDLAVARDRLERLRSAKIRTVVREKPVVKKVVKWVPNGKGVTVEVAGFKGAIEVRDVQLTHSFGYSDLVGIAINKTGRVISYAQLGCTFLDANGAVLANAMDNRSNWAPGATWGFSCGTQVEASGGILRVDQMG